MKKIISISNQKGGVGKTTTTINLATSLAAIKKSVLIVDADPQGNASTAAGIPKQEKSTLYNHYFDNKKIEECLYDSNDNFKIIPGGEDLIALEVAIRNDNKQGFLLKSLEPLSKTYNYTIIDTPPLSLIHI